MINFKKICKITVSMILAITMFPSFGVPAMAQEASGFNAKGIINVPDSVMLLSPMGGQVEAFSWEDGDMVEQYALAFAIKPAQIYATADGVITGLQAHIGDQAAAVQAQYGALCYLEREGTFYVNASTASAYNKPANRDVRIGDVLRVKTENGNDEETGEGTVTSVNGRNFVLEMVQGSFDLEDDVKLYMRTGSNYNSKDLVGKGTVVRPDAIPVLGDGVVALLLIKEGDPVVRGQPLFTLDSAGATYGEQEVLPEVRFSQAAMIASVLVQPGQYIVQGQAVMSLLPVGTLDAALEVDELDIAKVSIGQSIRILVDAYPGQEFTGTVAEIRPLGITVLDTTKFIVNVSLPSSTGLMVGMHLTGYWN